MTAAYEELSAKGVSLVGVDPSKRIASFMIMHKDYPIFDMDDVIGFVEETGEPSGYILVAGDIDNPSRSWPQWVAWGDCFDRVTRAGVVRFRPKRGDEE